MLTACAHAPAAAPAVDLSWLEGAWVSEDAESVTTELWTRDGDGWRGTSETKRAGEVVFTEALVIERRGDAIFYVASPSGQATTAFRLVTHEGTAATFENPTHDYPTRIHYVRTGDTLVARISGLRDGKETSSEWKLRRVE